MGSTGRLAGSLPSSDALPAGTNMGTDTDFVPMELARLRDDTTMCFDLYLNKGERFQLYRRASSSLQFTKEDRDRLVAGGMTHLWVRVPTEENTGPTVLANLLSMPDEYLAPKAKAHLWYGSAKATAQRAIHHAVANGMLTEVEGLLDTTVGYLLGNASAFPALLSATMHDHSLHTHAVNVAVYSLGLGRASGMSATEELRDLGLAAFLHDVGKARVGLNVLHKAGPLTPDEWAVMRQHPAWGTELLSEIGGLPEGVLTVVMQHHERMDGSGYPRGLTAASLDARAKIVALADAFDAMTSVRAYKPAYSAYGALSLLKGDMLAGKVDSKLFVSLVLLIGNPASVGHA